MSREFWFDFCFCTLHTQKGLLVKFKVNLPVNWFFLTSIFNWIHTYVSIRLCVHGSQNVILYGLIWRNKFFWHKPVNYCTTNITYEYKHFLCCLILIIYITSPFINIIDVVEKFVLMTIEMKILLVILWE